MRTQLIRQAASNFVPVAWLLVFVIAAVCVAPTTAQATTYTSFADFFADLAGMGAAVDTLDFDGVAAGTTISDGGSLGGISFSSFSSGIDPLTVDDAYDTTSPDNFLGGPGVTGDRLFYGGDGFTMGFSSANAIGLAIITAEVPDDSIFDGDIELTASGETALLDVSEIQSTLGDGSLVFFLGVIDTSTFFTGAEFDSANEFFIFNVDDVTTGVIPEPMSILIWLGVGAVFAAGHTWRRRRKRAA